MDEVGLSWWLVGCDIKAVPRFGQTSGPMCPAISNLRIFCVLLSPKLTVPLTCIRLENRRLPGPAV